ncbi:MAG: hypothetical protein A2V83_03995 [Nitrospirae bacterium RBG_16_64_22]|nr:MAG: hypothetical protein A2V83_03995 [Nitrospirae bacterium RBG_16_64_22]
MSSRRTGWRRVETSIAWAATAVLFILPASAPAPEAGGLPSVPRTESAKPSSPHPSAAAPQEPDDGKRAAGRIKRLAAKGNCRQAIEAADRFAALYPDSPRLASVLWDQAECHRSISRGGR